MQREPSWVERWLARVFGDDEPTAFGSGWMAGTAEFRARYPVGPLRALLEVAIGVTFLLGATSLMLRRRRCSG